MVKHYFYVEGTGLDIQERKGKGGQTQNPYTRLHSGYGTAAHKDNKARFLVLIECKIDESMILPIESKWISMFEQIEEIEMEQNLNRASTGALELFLELAKK